MVSLAAAAVIVFLSLYGHFPDHKENTNPLILAGNRFIVPLGHPTIELSIDLAKSYIDSLYKANYPAEVDSPNEALMSEYPSVPLIVKLPNGVVIRSGDDVKLVGILSPITSILSPITSISNIHNTKYDTNYDITFRWKESLIVIHDILVLHVIINHNYWTGST